MTKEVVCHDGKCKYTEHQYDAMGRCINCNFVQKIEHELLQEELK